MWEDAAAATAASDDLLIATNPGIRRASLNKVSVGVGVEADSSSTFGTFCVGRAKMLGHAGS